MVRSRSKRLSTTRAGDLQRRQWLLGLMFTLLVAFLWHNGVLNRLELLTLDWRTQWFGFSSTAPSDRLAVIAIDDAALENVGRWPWDRAKLAGVVDELRLAGTSVVALDILLDDPQSPRLEERANLIPGQPGSIARIEDDRLLQQAISKHGSVIAAASFPFRREDIAIASGLNEDAPIAVRSADLYALLDKMPELRTMDREQAIERAKGLLPGFKDLVVTKGPQFEKLGLRWDAGTTLLAREADSSIASPSDIRRWASSIEPGVPVAAVGRAASRIASVTFDTYDPDGQTRRVPLWVSHHGRLWPSLGLAAVLKARGISMDRVHIKGDETILTALDGTEQRIAMLRARVNQSEVDGLHFITWPRSLLGKPADDTDINGWQWQFYDRASAETASKSSASNAARFDAEVPIGRVYEPIRIAAGVRENVRVVWQGLKVFQSQGLIDDDAAKQLDALWPDLRDSAEGFGVGEPRWKEALDLARAHFARSGKDAQVIVELALDGTTLEKLAEPDRTNVSNLQGALRALPENFRQIDAGLDRINRERAMLKQRLSGKICFVGWTATGSVSDFVATSIHPRTPGVHVHVAVANSVLTGFQRVPGPAWADLVVLIVLGVMGTWMGVRAGVLAAPVVVATLIIGWFGVSSGLLWDLWRSIWSVSGPAVAAAAGWLIVLLHRLLVEQRSRRKTEERFKSYVSPQVVDILVNNPELTTMKPQERELTVMFTDIAGFTTIAENLGSEGTANLLAKYLGTMTEIIQKEKATLDKYIGDAIVAFWGAPIEDPRHARNACRAVIAMAERLDAMNAEKIFGDDVILAMRIGLATGELMVGDFGNPPRNSSYTIIGDTANLASRLESANKAFGTRILVSDRVRELAGERDFTWRRIGRIRVKGKKLGVWVHELLLNDRVKGERTNEWIALSEAMIADYQAEKLDDALAKAVRLGTEFNDQGLSSAYGSAIAAWQAGTVEGNFDGCIILTDK